MKTAPVLLTGATGFLGRHVLAALGNRPVIALVRRAADWHAQSYAADYPLVEPLEGDLTGSEAWLEDPRLRELSGILHGAAVVHHSRRDPEPLRIANVEGTARIVRLAARNQVPMVFVSTSGTVACQQKPGSLPDEDAPYARGTVSGWPYYASKIEAERRARALAHEGGVPLTIIRPPIMLGPGDHRFRSTGHILRFLRGRLPFLIDGGISYCDIRDAAAAMVAALEHPARRPIYHLPGHDASIGEFFGLCAAVSGIAAPKHYLPFWAAWQLASLAEQAAHLTGSHSPLPDPVVIEMGRHHWGIGSKHAAQELGYQTRPARETLEDTITWLRANHPKLK